MNPENALILAEQRRQEIMHRPSAYRAHQAAALEAAESRRGPVRRLPHWHVSWSRTALSPAGTAAQPAAGKRGSSVVIVISAHRVA